VGASKNLINELHFISSTSKLFAAEVGVVIEMLYVIDTCVFKYLCCTELLFCCTLECQDNRCKNYNIIKEVCLVKVMKDNRGQKNCWFVSGIQEREEELQMSRSSEF
jgi:hypothetical protein